MVSRTAYTQLRYSPVLLAGTLIGLALVWLAPVGAILNGHGWRFCAGLFAFILAMLSYQPTLARYRQDRTWARALPAIALFYMAATIGSAFNSWRGTGAAWKNRAYGGAP